VLEVGSGTGQHAAYLAPRFPALTWQPSDPNPEMRRSIAAWAKQAAAPNLRPPIDLDARAATWPIGKAAAIICVNMIHISPWAATAGLMKGAVRLLGPDSILYLYGPYRAGGTRTAASNAAFDKSLKARNPQWGLRQVEEVKKAASKNGLQFIETVNMPNNNLSLVLDGPLRVPRP
jgi:SAM-dependent methyltransferase